jgi:hypothetical protein
MNGSTTTANAADATEAPTFPALFTQSTYPDRHKCHCRRDTDVGGAKFSAESGSVRYHPRTLWGPSQTSLAHSLSQSLSASMVEQARLFNLLMDHVNQDQPQASDSILPLSQLPMDLRKEERTSRSNKRVLSEIDVSEWEITYKETRPREGKRRCDTGKTTQLPVGETH